jgi:hypothetical protein
MDPYSLQWHILLPMIFRGEVSTRIRLLGGKGNYCPKLYAYCQVHDLLLHSQEPTIRHLNTKAYRNKVILYFPEDFCCCCVCCFSYYWQLSITFLTTSLAQARKNVTMKYPYTCYFSRNKSFVIFIDIVTSFNKS